MPEEQSGEFTRIKELIKEITNRKESVGQQAIFKGLELRAIEEDLAILTEALEGLLRSVEPKTRPTHGGEASVVSSDAPSRY